MNKAYYSDSFKQLSIHMLGPYLADGFLLTPKHINKTETRII